MIFKRLNHNPRKEAKLRDYYATIYQACETPKDEEQIIEILQAEYKINRKKCSCLLRDLVYINVLGTDSTYEKTFYYIENKTKKFEAKKKLTFMSGDITFNLAISPSGNATIPRRIRDGILTKVGRENNTQLLMKCIIQEVQIDGIWYSCERRK